VTRQKGCCTARECCSATLRPTIDLSELASVAQLKAIRDQMQYILALPCASLNDEVVMMSQYILALPCASLNDEVVMMSQAAID
jgi:hypothetical protein